jgi:FkbM family methyltransferase
VPYYGLSDMDFITVTLDAVHRIKIALLPKAELRKWPVIGGFIGRARRRLLREPVRLGEFRFYTDDGDSLGLLAHRDYEPSEQELYRAIIQPGETCVELGANLGVFAVLFGHLVGAGGKVYSFEPSPTNVALLRRNLALNAITNVEVIEKAASNRAETVTLHLSQWNCGDNRIYASNLVSDGAVAVEAVALDEFFASKPDHIDFLKIDIQGAELKALQGMEKMLHGNRVARILMEFWPYGLVRCGSEPGEVLKLLRRHGYSLHEITEVGKIVQVSDDELLRRFPASEENWLNVYATKKPLQEPLLGR